MGSKQYYTVLLRTVMRQKESGPRKGRCKVKLVAKITLGWWSL